MHKCVTDIIRLQCLWSYDQTALYKSIIIIIILRVTVASVTRFDYSSTVAFRDKLKVADIVWHDCDVL